MYPDFYTDTGKFYILSRGLITPPAVLDAAWQPEQKQQENISQFKLPAPFTLKSSISSRVSSILDNKQK